MVPTYNAAGARVYLVPAAYERWIATVELSLKNATTGDEEGLDGSQASDDDDYVDALSAGNEAAIDAALDALLDVRLRLEDVVV